MLASEVPPTVRVLVTGGGKDLLFNLDDDSFILRLRTEGRNRIHRLTPSQITKRAADLDVEVKEILKPKEIEISARAEDGTGRTGAGASEVRGSRCPRTGDAAASRPPRSSG